MDAIPAEPGWYWLSDFGGDYYCLPVVGWGTTRYTDDPSVDLDNPFDEAGLVPILIVSDVGPRWVKGSLMTPEDATNPCEISLHGVDGTYGLLWHSQHARGLPGGWAVRGHVPCPPEIVPVDTRQATPA